MSLAELTARCSKLEKELSATRKELAKARLALQRKKDTSPPLTTNAAVDALSTVLKHMLPEALLEARSEAAARIAALQHRLSIVEARAFTSETSAEGFRNEVWTAAHAGLADWVDQEEALLDVCHLVEFEDGGG